MRARPRSSVAVPTTSMVLTSVLALMTAFAGGHEEGQHGRLVGEDTCRTSSSPVRRWAMRSRSGPCTFSGSSSSTLSSRTEASAVPALGHQPLRFRQQRRSMRTRELLLPAHALDVPGAPWPGGPALRVASGSGGGLGQGPQGLLVAAGLEEAPALPRGGRRGWPRVVEARISSSAALLALQGRGVGGVQGQHASNCSLASRGLPSSRGAWPFGQVASRCAGCGRASASARVCVARGSAGSAPRSRAGCRVQRLWPPPGPRPGAPGPPRAPRLVQLGGLARAAGRPPRVRRS